MFRSINISKLVLFLFLIIGSSAFAQRNLAKGNRLFDMGQYERAIPFFEKEVSNPERLIKIEAITKIADCYRLLGNFELAEKNYKNAISKGGGKEAVYNYGLALKAAAKYAEAKEIFLRYQKLNPDDPRGLMMAKSCDLAEKMIVEDPLYDVVEIKQWNTDGVEISPMYYKNGILFSSQRKGGRKPFVSFDGANNAPLLDLYFIEFNGTDKSFANPVYFFPQLNSNLHEGPPSFSPDGNEIYFTRTVEGERLNKSDKVVQNTLQVFYSKLNKDSSWTNPKSAFYFNSINYSVFHPSLSKDGKMIFFASDMPGGVGGTDIYVSYKEKNGRWSQPYNLGPDVNSVDNELFPFYDNDGSLYFSSNGHPGMGKLDIFKSTYDSLQGWTHVENLRAPMNSIGDDICYFEGVDKGKGFIVSDRINGTGSDDIYIFNKKEPLEIIFDYDYLHIKDLSAYDQLTFSVSKSDKKAVEFEENENYFTFKPDLGENYRITVRKDGFLFNRIDFTIQETADSTREFIVLSSMKDLDVKLITAVKIDKSEDEETQEEVVVEEEKVSFLKKVKDVLKGNKYEEYALNKFISYKEFDLMEEYVVFDGVEAKHFSGDKDPIVKKSNEKGHLKFRIKNQENNKIVLKKLTDDQLAQVEEKIALLDSLKNLKDSLKNELVADNDSVQNQDSLAVEEEKLVDEFAKDNKEEIADNKEEIKEEKEDLALNNKTNEDEIPVSPDENKVELDEKSNEKNTVDKNDDKLEIKTPDNDDVAWKQSGNQIFAKINTVYKGKSLKNVHFDLLNGDKLISKIESDDEGKLNLDNLAPNMLYTIQTIQDGKKIKMDFIPKDMLAKNIETMELEEILDQVVVKEEILDLPKKQMPWSQKNIKVYGKISTEFEDEKLLNQSFDLMQGGNKVATVRSDENGWLDLQNLLPNSFYILKTQINDKSVAITFKPKDMLETQDEVLTLIELPTNVVIKEEPKLEPKVEEEIKLNFPENEEIKKESPVEEITKEEETKVQSVPWLQKDKLIFGKVDGMLDGRKLRYQQYDLMQGNNKIGSIESDAYGEIILENLQPNVAYTLQGVKNGELIKTTFTPQQKLKSQESSLEFKAIPVEPIVNKDELPYATQTPKETPVVNEPLVNVPVKEEPAVEIPKVTEPDLVWKSTNNQVFAGVTAMHNGRNLALQTFDLLENGKKVGTVKSDANGIVKLNNLKPTALYSLETVQNGKNIKVDFIPKDMLGKQDKFLNLNELPKTALPSTQTLAPVANIEKLGESETMQALNQATVNQATAPTTPTGVAPISTPKTNGNLNDLALQEAPKVQESVVETPKVESKQDLTLPWTQKDKMIFAKVDGMLDGRKLRYQQYDLMQGNNKIGSVESDAYGLISLDNLQPNVSYTLQGVKNGELIKTTFTPQQKLKSQEASLEFKAIPVEPIVNKDELPYAASIPKVEEPVVNVPVIAEPKLEVSKTAEPELKWKSSNNQVFASVNAMHNGRNLAFQTFDLLEDGKKVGTVKSDANGIVKLSNLKPTSVYSLQTLQNGKTINIDFNPKHMLASQDNFLNLNELPKTALPPAQTLAPVANIEKVGERETMQAPNQANVTQPTAPTAMAPLATPKTNENLNNLPLQEAPKVQEPLVEVPKVDPKTEPSLLWTQKDKMIFAKVDGMLDGRKLRYQQYDLMQGNNKIGSVESDAYGVISLDNLQPNLIYTLQGVKNGELIKTTFTPQQKLKSQEASLEFKVVPVEPIVNKDELPNLTETPKIEEPKQEFKWKSANNQVFASVNAMHNGRNLAFQTFDILENGKKIGTVTSDANGVVQLGNLKPTGVYSLQTVQNGKTINIDFTPKDMLASQDKFLNLNELPKTALPPIQTIAPVQNIGIIEQKNNLENIPNTKTQEVEIDFGNNTNNNPEMNLKKIVFEMDDITVEELFLKIPERKKGEEQVLVQLGTQEMVLPNQEFILYTNGVPTVKGLSNEQGLIALNMNLKANQTLEYKHNGNTYQVPLNQGKVVANEGIKAIELKALAANIIPEENLPKVEIEQSEKELWLKNQGQFNVNLPVMANGYNLTNTEFDLYKDGLNFGKVYSDEYGNLNLQNLDPKSIYTIKTVQKNKELILSFNPLQQAQLKTNSLDLKINDINKVVEAPRISTYQGFAIQDAIAQKLMEKIDQNGNEEKTLIQVKFNDIPLKNTDFTLLENGKNKDLAMLPNLDYMAASLNANNDYVIGFELNNKKYQVPLNPSEIKPFGNFKQLMMDLNDPNNILVPSMLNLKPSSEISLRSNLKELKMDEVKDIVASEYKADPNKDNNLVVYVTVKHEEEMIVGAKVKLFKELVYENTNYTDFSGKSMVFANASEVYSLTVSKHGYKVEQFSFIPKQYKDKYGNLELVFDLKPLRKQIVKGEISSKGKVIEGAYVDVYFDDEVVNTTQTDVDGKYELELFENEEYLFSVNQQGFFQNNFKVKTGKKVVETKTNLIELEADKPVNIPNIYFAYKDFRLNPLSVVELDRLAVFIQKNPQIKKLQILAHTDAIGSDWYNINLSEKRAETVRRYLERKGISPDKIESKGLGKSQLLIQDAQEDSEHAVNRRIEFKLILD